MKDDFWTQHKAMQGPFRAKFLFRFVLAKFFESFCDQVTRLMTMSLIASLINTKYKILQTISAIYIPQYWVWTLIFQICIMYTAFLDEEISHQSPRRHPRWHWMHLLRCLCCIWCCAADLVLRCTKLCSCSSRQHSHTTDKYADQNRNLT